MKKKKKIALLTVLSLLICLLIVSPFASYAAAVDNNGLPSLDMKDMWSGQYMQGSQGWDIFKGDTSGRLNTTSITFNPDALLEDSAWGTSVRLIPLSTLEQPDYSIDFVIESVKGSKLYTHTKYHIGVNDGYTSISITHYSVDADNELYNGRNVLSHTLTDFKPLVLDLGLYWSDNPNYIPEIRLDGISTNGNTSYYYYQNWNDSTDVPMGALVNFSIDINNVAENDTLLVSYSPIEDYIWSSTPNGLAEQVIALNASLPSFLYKFGGTADGNIEGLLQSKYEEGYNDGQISADGYYKDYYQGIINTEKDKAYKDGYNKGYTSGKADGNSGDYNEGYNDGLDEGYRLGVDTANKIPESIDKIGLVITESLAIFGGYGNLFGYSILDLIASFVSVIIAFVLARKLVQLL